MLEKPLTHHRPQWKSHLGFLLAAIGSAIGLGNIWRFSYLCYKNGGGAFLIPYFTALILVGIPLMILEIAIGHKMRGSAPASFASISKKWEWLGWWQVIFVVFGIAFYYSVVISWCLNYFFLSFNLGWGQDPNNFFFNKFLMLSNNPFDIKDVRTPIVGGLIIIWLLNWIIVYSGIKKGVERANKIFMPLLFSLIAIIVIWSIRLNGAEIGLAKYFHPDFSRLKDIKVWVDAFSQIFFTLSLGFGVMIAYASYLPQKTEIVKDSIIISFTNCIFSLIAGIGVFSILGYMAQTTNQNIEQVVSQSIGLAFVAYPKAISMLPAFPQIFGVLFFGTLVIAGLSSSISMIEALTCALIDKFHYSRKTIVSILTLTGFFGSIIFASNAGLYWLDIVDHFLTQYGLLTGAILQCVLLAWIYKAENLRTHINKNSSWPLQRWWTISIKFISPIVLIGICISSLIDEIAQPYSGYSRLHLILIGRDWLIYTLFIAIIVAAHQWKIHPSKRLIK